MARSSPASGRSPHPVLGPDGGVRGALAVVFVDDSVDTAEVGRAVMAAAAQVGPRLR